MGVVSAPDHQRDLGQAGQDPGAGGVQSLGAGRAGGVRRGDGGAVPAQGLGERRAGDVAGVPVADRLAADHQVDLAPVDAGVVQRRPGRHHAVLGERASPLAPGVHAHAEDRDVGAHWSASPPSSVTGFQRHTSSSPSSGSTTSSTSAPTLRSLTP